MRQSIATLLACALALPTAAAELKVRFIGNEAFEITDGKVTLLSDFPYQSGYSIYMTYPETEIRPRERSLCLITHRHGDHFESELMANIGCRVVATDEITRGLDGVEVIPLEPEIRSGDIRIEPIRTPHRDTEHYSYLVEWHGLRLYFVGDTETPEYLRDDLDVLFISPWLLNRMERAGIDPPAEKVVVYHHTADEKVECGRCLVPSQGDTFVIGEP